MVSPAPFDPFSAQLHGNPYPIYEAYRAQEPVHRGLASAPGYDHSWYIFSYQHVLEVLKEPRLSNQRQMGDMDTATDSQKVFYETLSHWLLFRDPPVHTQHRRLLSQAFSARNFAPWRDDIIEVSNQQVRVLLESDGSSITRDCFRVIPVKVISRILGADILDLETMMECTDSFAKALDFRTDTAVFDRAAENIERLLELLVPQIENRRKKPRSDLMSRLVEANHEGHFSDRELVYMVMLMLTAGYETTINQMGNAFLALMKERAQWDFLINNRDKMSSAIHELIRYDSPLQVMSRSVTEDVTIGGQHIRAGDDVNLMFGSANRDANEFEHPNRLDLQRANANRNLTFGHGIHFCIGAQLARLEIAAVLEALMDQSPDIRLDENQTVTWKSHISLRGPEAIPVTY